MLFDDDDKLKLETHLISFPHPFHMVSLHFKVFHQSCGSLISSLWAGWFLKYQRYFLFFLFFNYQRYFWLSGSRLPRAKFCPFVAPKRVMRTSDNYFAFAILIQ